MVFKQGGKDKSIDRDGMVPASNENNINDRLSPKVRDRNQRPSLT